MMRVGPLILRRTLRVFMFLCVASVLSGCQGGGLDIWYDRFTRDRTLTDLEEFVEEQRKPRAGKIDPLPTIARVEPFIYSAGELTDPFSPDNVDRPWEVVETSPVTVEEQQEEDLGPDPLEPDMARERTELENFQLDALQLVGVFQSAGETKGIILLLAVNETRMVKVGSYIGPNYGQVANIDRDGGIVTINERKQGTNGRWAESVATLSYDGQEPQ